MTAPAPVVTAPGLLFASSPGAWQLTYNGLLIGGDVGLDKITGLREMPPTRSEDVDRPRRHGAYAGRTVFGERIITADLVIKAPGNDFQGVLAAVAQAFANIADPNKLLPLQFSLGDWPTPRQVWCRPTKGGVPIDVDYQYRSATIPLELTCPDPLIYDTAQQAATTGLPSPTAGLGFPAGFPATFGASSGGSLQLVNAGNEDAPLLLTITGPCTFPQVTLGNAFLAFDLTLGPTDTLTIDTNAATAILNGTASRGGTVITGSDYFLLPAASSTGPTTSSLGFSSADATQVSGTLTATASSAWGWC